MNSTYTSGVVSTEQYVFKIMFSHDDPGTNMSQESLSDKEMKCGQMRKSEQVREGQSSEPVWYGYIPKQGLITNKHNKLSTTALLVFIAMSI